MKTGEWTLRSRRVVTPSGIRAADVVIRNEIIAAIDGHDNADSEGVIFDVGDLIVLPGLVALHMEGPGRSDWDGFESATRDAASGGVTTLVDLPSDHDSTSNSPKAFLGRMAAADGKLRVDCGLVVGLGSGNADQVQSWIESGVIGIEAFLGGPGLREFSTEADLRAAMSILARLDRPLLIHAERSSRPESASMAGDRFGSVLPDREFEAIRLLIRLCRESRCRVHLIHPTASEALPMLAEARAEGLPLTVETCPHHLSFAKHEVIDGLPTFNLKPTWRGPDVRERLWESLRDGLIDVIGSDHPQAFERISRSGPGEVRPFRREYTSLRLALSAAWMEATHRGFTPVDMARWMSTKPALAFGLSSRKGAIETGLDADLIVFDPDVSFIADPGPLHRRNPAPPLDGRTLTGRVEATILRGTLIYHAGQFFDDPRGNVVLRLEETIPMPGSMA